MKFLLAGFACRTNLLKNSFLILCILIRTSTSGQGKAETETIFVTPFGLEQGLRQSMVSHVIQDSNGLIWMTTGDGLHWFDGREFRAFRVPVNSGFSHSDNLMRNIVESRPGILSLSTSSSILHFTTSSARFKTVFRKLGSYPIIMQVLIEQKPVAWFSGNKICLVGKERIFPQKLIFEANNELPGNFYPRNAILSASKELLISGEDGILTLDLTNRNNVSTFRAKWIPVKDFQAIAGDKTGRVFILAQGKIYQYREKGKMTEFFNTHIMDKMNLFIDNRENFWITGRTSRKQYKLSGGMLKELRLCTHDGKHTDWIFPDIRSVFEDDHHNIWFGTDGDGVLLYSPGKAQFMRSDIGFTRCLAWFNNEIWAGTYNEGLWRISSDLSEAHQVRPKRINQEEYYLDLAADKKERLWIATRNGLEVIDHMGHTLFKHALICQKANLNLQSGDTVTLFCEEKYYRFLSGDKISYLGSREFIAVSSILSTRDALWIGNQFGLYRGMKSSGLDKNLLFTAGNQLSDVAVFSLLRHEGSIWSASRNGIEIFDEDGKKRPVPGNIKELQNEVIYSLLPDNRGQIWFSCNHGIGCINAKKNQVIYFGTENNLQSLEFNSNAACSSPDGRLYFGGIRGINGFNPSWFNPGKKDSKAKMISLYLSDTAYAEGIPPGYLEMSLGRKAPHVSGSVFCSDFTNSGSQLFSFLLQGYQEAWSKPSREPDFNYRDLPPGNYRLLVKCADSWQNWSEPVTLLSLTLHPPVWKRGWFLVGIIFLIIAITALVARKINSIRYWQRILVLEQQNAVEKERLRISKDMHDEIGASLTRISILSELAKNQKEDRNEEMKVIAQISEIAGGVVDEMSEIIWAMNPKNDTLDSFAAYFRQYVSSYLETAGINARFHFSEVIPSFSMSSELRRNFFLTMKEALHNVVKHSAAKDVEIWLNVDEDLLQMVIKDNGNGFNTEKKRDWGNGLNNMRKRIEELGGLFTITSEIGIGTTIQFSVDLPFDKKSH